MKKEHIQLLDIVALVVDLPKESLHKGEVGTVVECYPDDAYEVEFVANDGGTYALLPLVGSQLVALRERPRTDAKKLVPHGRP